MSKQARINDAIKSSGLMMLLTFVLSMGTIKLALVVGSAILVFGAFFDEVAGPQRKVDWYSVVGDAAGIFLGISLNYVCHEYIGIF